MSENVGLCPELLLRGVILIILCRDLCKAVSRTSLTPGRRNSSPIVYGCPNFVKNKMFDAWNPSVFCLEALQNMLDRVVMKL